VKIILLIAADSIRALLHQRLLIGLMIIALALIAIFSAILVGERKMVTQNAAAVSAANAASDESAAGGADAAASANAGNPKAPAKKVTLSKEDRQKMAEAMDQMSSMFQTGFYAVASFGGSLVSLFIFSTAIAAEIRKGTIRITLTKPVSRTQFLLGKYLGGVAVMAGYALIASAAIILFTRFNRLELSPAMEFAPWLMFCRQLMLGALAMLLSLFVHPFVASVLAFLAGNGLYGHHNPLFYLFPSYQPFSSIGQILQGTLMSGHDVLLLTLYAADFIVLMMLLALWRFHTKELV